LPRGSWNPDHHRATAELGNSSIAQAGAGNYNRASVFGNKSRADIGGSEM
jgi:hypothetical protein